MPSLLLPFLCILLGCGCSDRLDFIHYDNPKIRSLQADQRERYLPGAAARNTVMKIFGPRVGLIILGDPEKPTVGSGRAAAISSDGYYLTASHVLGDGPFYLSESPASDSLTNNLRDLSQQELEDLFRTETYRGRLVWVDPDIDLAIVKFHKRNPQYFGIDSKEIPVGSIVYSADDSGLGMIVENRSGLESMVGNGPFLVAGVVSAVKRLQNPRDGLLIETSIISRGGMSGSPVADRNGRLRGIIMHIDVNRRHSGNTRTVAGIVSGDRIRKIVADDRRSPGRALVK